MINRRKFIQASAFTGLASALGKKLLAGEGQAGLKGRPTIISTWAPNVKANAAAWEVLGQGGRALDAVVQGVQVPEADPNDNSVGYGGLPDRDGKVTLDSCVMDEHGQCGSVMAIENIMHPVLVARMVMEKTPHVVLAGDGALQFALEQGFQKMNLLTEKSEKAWKDWLKKSHYDPMRTVKELEDRNDKEKKNSSGNPGHQEYPWPVAGLNHDTIGMIALDTKGNLGGACTTSGMAFKIHGRVGDSPIIGAGLYVDNEVGAATSTGVGEEVVKVCGSHTVVEAMRHGATPEQACKEAVRRIVKINGEKAKDVQVGFIAINTKGQYGAFAIQKNFTYCVTTNAGTKVFDSKHWF
ncbi:MAG: N(4)-(beta-N-acetylglucosaminyl)-L-asparaginase [Chitinophagaceae bacterium]